MRTLFFYGSLRDEALIEIVLGRAVAAEHVTPARAPGFATRRLEGVAYPMLVPRAGEAAEGVVLGGLSEDDLARLRFFEEAEYGLAPITVETAQGPVETHYFLATDKPTGTDVAWDFDRWWRESREIAHEEARELMRHFGHLPVEEIDTIWPGITIRARQRVRARHERVALADLRTDFGRGDVTVERLDHPHTGFLKVEEYRLSHRTFDGGWSRPMERTAVLWGDAVTVLPFDPATGRVLLIEQFRVSAFARGAPNPWCVEVVAGLLDGDEAPGDAARREAREEAGLEVGRMAEIGRYYTSSGLAGEFVVSFVAEADLSGAGGVHGLAVENEDIRSIVVDLDHALAAVAEGAVNTGPAVASLAWLAANRARLTAEWQGVEPRRAGQ